MQPENEAEKFLLSEESLSVEKRRIVTGRVRVRSVTDTIETFARAELDGEAVEVTRVPVNQPVDEPPSVRTEGDLTIFPVLEEVLVLEKRLYLKEEIHVRRRRTRESVEVPVTLQRQRALVEHVEPDTATALTEPHSHSEAESND
jgi:uncharacterized protein (TIGR02271 family)